MNKKVSQQPEKKNEAKKLLKYKSTKLKLLPNLSISYTTISHMANLEEGSHIGVVFKTKTSNKRSPGSIVY